MKRKIIQFSGIVLLTGLVSACSYLPGLHTYDVRQGNEIDPEHLKNVTVGMSQTDVKRILGTPLVHDPYHPNVWNYTFLHSLSSGEEIAHQNIRVVFDKNKHVQSVDVLQ